MFLSRREFLYLCGVAGIGFTFGGLSLPAVSEAVIMEYDVNAYIAALKKLSATNLATEHSFRGPLETLINAADKRFTAVNEPKRQACGAPDYVVLNNATGAALSVGYLEAKDIWVSLDKIQKTDQFRRYAAALDNLILTNYIEFRWFVRGELRNTLVLGRYSKGKPLDIFPGKEDALRSLLHDFLNFPIEAVTSAQELALRMAKLTHAIRDTVFAALDSPYKENLEVWRKAFADTLLPDLMQDNRKADFADMYAQTIAYGFFAARCHHDIGKKEFERKNAQEDIPKTNPLLRGLFVNLTGPDLKEEPYYQFVEDLIQLLALADMKSVLKDFGEHDQRTDPVLHFYETFLEAYDPKLREVRGVYYTPEPVVSWLVRSADAVVREQFAIPQGLADNTKKLKVNGTGQEVPKVLILDPACGTGTFLYETIALIRNRLKEQGQSGIWSAFVKESLLPRIFGFELLMAPYAVAHFKLGMQLAGYDVPGAERQPWAYDFSASERLKIYLTNTLEGLEQAFSLPLPGLMKALSDEGAAARKVKHSLPVLVIMGNPPYAGHSANASWRTVGRKKEMTFIGRLIEDYKKVDGNPLDEANPKWLQDDYVKFIRWAQWKLDKVEEGVVAFVTNHGYLDNPTFRGMRQSLMRSFDEIYVYDLHGNTRKKEKAPDGSPDQNVFDIQQGVALALFVKRKDGDRKALARVFHAELYGERQAKYERLFSSDVTNTEWKELQPTTPNYLFISQDEGLAAEYGKGVSVTEIFPAHSVGIVTARDKLAIHFTEEEVWKTVKEFIALPVEEARRQFDLGQDARDWKVEMAQEDIRKSGPDKKYIRKILYRPFDTRYTYYTGKTRGFICMPRFEVMNNMISIPDNIALITSRLTKGEKFNHIQASRMISEVICMSPKTSNNGFIFPLYVHAYDGKKENINTGVVKFVESLFDSKFESRDIFYYIYSFLSSHSYQSRYEEMLRHGFPKIQFTQDIRLFSQLTELGKELIMYHTLEHPKLSDAGQWLTSYPVVDNSEQANRVERSYPKYDGQGKVFINASQYFSGVPADVWGYTIGGYQVATKWLKDRAGRKLSLDEIQTYQQIILALSETIRIRREIDGAMPPFPWL